jgi:DinB superfamily
MPNHDQSLRQHLLELLQGGHAHATFDAVIANIPANLLGKKPAGYPHSLWMLLEHLRLAQWDILEFSRNPKYSAPKWPDDYWPKSAAQPSPAAWNASVKKFRADLTTTQNLVKNPRTDLFAKIPWGDGQTILREVLLLADHNSHHLAQMIDIRRLLGDWPSR